MLQQVTDARLHRGFGVRLWFDPDFINFHAVRPEKYRIGDLVLEQFQRGLARAELVNAGIVIAPDGRVPECLKPRPAPQIVLAATQPNWQHKAVNLSLGLFRRAGMMWGRYKPRG